MFLKSNIDYLLEKFKTNPNELDEQHGIPQSTIFRIQNGLTENPRQSTLRAISEWSGVPVGDLLTKDLRSDDFDNNNSIELKISPISLRVSDEKTSPIKIPVYRDIRASCGDGIENFLEDVSDYLEISSGFFELLGIKTKPENLKIIYSDEYSMWPTVAPGSPLFIDVSDRDPSFIKNGQVYVFTHNNELRMKRIFISYAGERTVRLSSDNPDKVRYPDEFITNEQLNGINFVGRLESAFVRL